MVKTKPACDRNTLLLDQMSCLIDRIGGYVPTARKRLRLDLFSEDKREGGQNEFVCMLHDDSLLARLAPTRIAARGWGVIRPAACIKRSSAACRRVGRALLREDRRFPRSSARGPTVVDITRAVPIGLAS
jgi:hypothetical protein